MAEPWMMRNVGFLRSPIAAGQDIVKFICDEIKARNPDWNANELHMLSLCAMGQNNMKLEINGWTWETTEILELNNCRINSVIAVEAILDLKMAFRYDD